MVGTCLPKNTDKPKKKKTNRLKRKTVITTTGRRACNFRKQNSGKKKKIHFHRLTVQNRQIVEVLKITTRAIKAYIFDGTRLYYRPPPPESTATREWIEGTKKKATIVSEHNQLDYVTSIKRLFVEKIKNHDKSCRVLFYSRALLFRSSFTRVNYVYLFVSRVKNTYNNTY